MPLPEELDREGFAILPAVFSDEEVSRISPLIEACELKGAGARELLRFDWCRKVAGMILERMVRIGVLDQSAVAIQCNLFSKRASSNWKVAVHQDLVMPVAAPVDDERLSGWSVKDGVHYARLPDPLLRKMLAVRLHVDACLVGDGPLQVVPGSHREGALPVNTLASMADRLGRVRCEAQAGQLILMRPLLVHASSKATDPAGARRVLHYVFGPADPGYGLAWSSNL